MFPNISSKLLGIRMRGWTIDVSLSFFPTFLLPTCFFFKEHPPEKKTKKTHTHKKNPPAPFLLGIMVVPLKIPMISKIPGWVSLPVNDLQSTLSLPTRQIARNASAVPGCPFRKTSSFSGSAVFLGAAGWSPSNGG